VKVLKPSVLKAESLSRGKVSHRSLTTSVDAVRGISSSNNKSSTNQDWLEEKRREILTYAMKHIPQYGWSDETLLEGARDATLPPTMIACVHSGKKNGGAAESLITHHMDSCYHDVETYIHQQSSTESWASKTPAQIIADCIQYRLRLNISLMSQNGRWAEAMAIGARPPSNTLNTAAQIDNLMDLIGKGALSNTSTKPHNSWSFVERSMVASVYVMTELHLLQACSNITGHPTEASFQDTWRFLDNRVAELEFLANGNVPPNLFFKSTEAAVAAGAVVSSLGKAVLSVLNPTASLVATSVMSQATSVFSASLGTTQYPNTNHGHSATNSSLQNSSSSNTSMNRSFHNDSSHSISNLTSPSIGQDIQSETSNLVHGIDLNSLPPFPEKGS
jgi:rpsU-divergently transcribed protein